MGCCASVSTPSPKDPDDLSLDDIEIEKLRVASADDTFESGGDLLNGLISINNSVVESVINIRTLSMLFVGGFVLTPNEDGTLQVTRYVQNKEEQFEPEDVPQADIDGQPAMAVAIAAVNKTAALLKDATAAAKAELSATKNGRRKLAGKMEIDIACAAEGIKLRALIASYNHELFSARKAAAIACAKIAAADFKESLMKLKEIMSGNTKFKPEVKVNKDLIAEAGQGKTVDYKQVLVLKTGLEESDLFGREKQAYEALLGDDGLINCISTAVEELASVSGNMQSVMDAVNALSSDTIMQEAQSSGLAPMQMLKLPGKFATNVQAIGTTPEILKTCEETIIMCVDQVQQVMG